MSIARSAIVLSLIFWLSTNCFAAPPETTLKHLPKTKHSSNRQLRKDFETVEAFFEDDHGSKSVAPDFDSAPGEICGNGRSYYWTSDPPQKSIPANWRPPPAPGSDPEYDGPDPVGAIKESPYAMPSSKAVLRRESIKDSKEPRFAEAVQAYLEDNRKNTAVLTTRSSLHPPFADQIPSPMFLDHRQYTGASETTLVARLRDLEARYLLVDREVVPVAPWAEPDLIDVRVRLRDILPLRHFRALVIGSGWVLYEVAEASSLSSQDMQTITAYVRSKLAGNPPSHLPIQSRIRPASANLHRVVISLRYSKERGLKGRKLTRKIGKGTSLRSALDMAVSKIVSGWQDASKANFALYGVHIPQKIESVLPNLQIEVDLLQDLAEVTDKSLTRLHWYFELGVHGMGIQTASNFYYLEPSYAVHRERKSIIQFLLKLLTRHRLTHLFRTSFGKSRINIEQWFTDKMFRLIRFNTLSWIETPKRIIVPLYRGVPLKTLESVSKDSMLRSLKLGAEWLKNNQHSDGQYAYKYLPLNKPGRRWSAGGNIVRHALNPYSLLLVHSLSPDPALVQSARKGINFTLSFLRQQGGRCVICHRDPPARYYNAKTGTNAVTLLGLLQLSKTEDISMYRDTLDCLAQEILYMQDRNGHFRQFDVPRDHPYYGAESTIAPGEIVLALARMYEFTKEPAYLEAAEKAIPYYIKQWRQMVSNRTRDGIYNEEDRVNIVGIIPWMVMAFDDLHRATGKEEFVDLAYEMQGWIDREVFYSIGRSAYVDYLGASFKTHRELPAINACQFTEGSSSAYNIAKRSKRDIAKRREILLLGVRFCLQLQYDGFASTFFTPLPEEVMGGYRYHLGVLRLRNDYSYHAISALAQSATYLEETDYQYTQALGEALPEYFKRLS